MFGDVDGDGDMDVVLPTFQAGIYVLRKESTGSFSVEQPVTSTPNLWGGALGDVDGNGTLDLVMYGPAGFFVYKNQ